MILKKVKITNYRQLQNVELDMQDSLTVLAGPNNSGKTTLISVLKGMFCDKKLSFNYSDIPIQLSSDWLDKILPIFQAVMIKYDRESGVREIITKISNDDKFIADYIMDSFQAQIQVDYNPDNDDIQYFADYLMDLDDTKHSFYFIYTYEPSISSFEKNLTEHYDRMSARFRDINNPQGVEKDTKLYFLKEELLRLYCNAAIEKCYFCNSDYGNANPMEVFAFKNLFNFQMLKMKTLIITDLDYNKDAMSMEEVKREDSKSTNATINYCYRLVHADREKDYSPTIKELYDFQVKGESVLYNGLVYLTFQDEKSTARTLEEAMLNKLLKVDVFHAIKRSEWKEKRKINNLTFSIPNNKENEEDSEYSIHRIVEATSNNKTDFMYSVILSGNEKKMLPDYIEKGLLWLAK